MANVVLPKIRCSDEKADNEKTGSSGAPSSRKKVSVTEGISKIQSKIANDTDVVLRVDGLGPVGGIQEDVKDEKPLLVAKLDPQIAEQVRWEDLKNKNKLNQNLHELLLITSIGIKIEITKSRGCRGAVVVPVFHCKRCLQNWNRFKQLPTDCNEEPEYIRGFPILVEQSSITELEENSEGSNITLPIIDCDKDSPITGNSISSNEDIYLEKIAQKYEGKKQKLEIVSRVKNQLPGIPPLDQGGRLSQLENSIMRPATPSKEFPLSNTSRHTLTCVSPSGNKRTSPGGVVSSRESEADYSNSYKSQRADKSQVKGSQKDESSTSHPSLSLEKEGHTLTSKTRLYVSQGDLKVTKGSSLVQIYSTQNVAIKKPDELQSRHFSKGDNQITFQESGSSSDSVKNVEQKRTETNERSNDNKIERKIQNQKYQEFTESEKEIEEKVGSTGTSAETVIREVSDVKEQARNDTKIKDKDFFKANKSSDKEELLEHPVDHKVSVGEKVANIKAKTKERRKSIQSNVKNPAVANRTGKPDTAHQSLKKHMMSLAKGASTTLGGLEGQREDLSKPSYTRRPSTQEQRLGSSLSRPGSHFQSSDPLSSTTTMLSDFAKERRAEVQQHDDYGLGFRSNSMMQRVESKSDASQSQGLPSIDDKVQRTQDQNKRKMKETYKKKTRKGTYNELLGRRRSKDAKELLDSDSVTSSSNDLPPLFEIEDFKNSAGQASNAGKEPENQTLGSVPFKYETRGPSVAPNAQGNNISYFTSLNAPPQSPLVPVQAKGRHLRQRKGLGDEEPAIPRNRRVSFSDASRTDDFSAVPENTKSVKNCKNEPRSLTPSPEPSPRKKVTSLEIAALKMMSFTTSFTFSYYDLPKPYLDFNEMVKTSINSVGRRARRRFIPTSKKKV